jgi:tRNA(fMet)-specific endonuclease VapC
MRYLVDADWLIDAVIGRPAAVRTLERLSDDGLAVSIVAMAELYEGAFGTPNPQDALTAFREFLGAYAILPLTDPVVEHFARLRATLRQQGQLIPDMDLFIAATALESDLALVTRNVRHFGRIPSLQLYTASSSPANG